MSRWKTVGVIAELPNCCATYVVYGSAGPVYIGSAVNLHGRFYLHGAISGKMRTFIQSGDLQKIKYRRSVKYGDWAMVELRLLRRLKPELNTHGKVVARVEPAVSPRRRKAWRQYA